MKIEPEKRQSEEPPKMEREDLLEDSELGFDFFFTKFPHISKLQILWFFLVNYCWVVGGLVQVGSIILQATPGKIFKNIYIFTFAREMTKFLTT
jgi:hypothetical protein